MLLLTNNAEGTLAAGIGAGDTTIVLTAGHGARFPATSAEDYFYATLIDTSNNREIIKVTTRSTDTLTVVRSQDGTTPLAFLTSDRLALRWNRAMIQATVQESSQRTATSGTDTYTATLAPLPKAYDTGQVYCIFFGNANTLTNPTLNLNSLGAKTIKNRTGTALIAGQLNGTHFLYYDGTDFILLNPRSQLEGIGIKGTGVRVSTAAAGGLAYGSERGHISGLNTSNNAGDLTNDIDIAVGEAASDDTAFTSRTVMELTSALTKRIDAAWAVGTNLGGLDGTESVPGTPDNDTWYYVWLIHRPDTGVTDVLFSESSTSPTMPTNYTKKRLIGVVRRETATNRKFYQIDEQIWWQSQVNVLSGGTATSETAVTITSAIPAAVARAFECSARSDVTTFDSSPDAFSSVVVRVATGVDYAVLAAIAGSGEAIGWTIRSAAGMSEIPVTGFFSYYNSQSNTNSRAANIWVHGFKLAR